MELSVNSYMSPWTSNDYSACLSVKICDRWISVTERSDLPFDFSRFAGALANLTPTSAEVLFGMQSLEGNCVVQVGFRIAPQPLTDTFLVEVSERDGVETIVREMVSLADLNRLGQDLLVASNSPEFEYEFSDVPGQQKPPSASGPSQVPSSEVATNSQPNFVPRVGKLTFPCKFCGKEPMQWSEIAPDTWMPVDLEKREVHHCWSNRPTKISIRWVADALTRLGYEAYVPRTSSWQMAFAANNEAGCLIFLIRKHGIDFKIYDKPEEFRLDEKGKLFTGGGEIVRNHFNESEVFVFDWVLDIASRFVTETPLDRSHLVGQGRPWSFHRARSIRAKCLPQGEQGRRELREIYDAISVGDGMDAYLGDGIWVGRNGSWSDRGR